MNPFPSARVGLLRVLRAFLAVAFLAGLLSGAPRLPADEASDRLNLAVDALTRLQGVDLNANATLKERVLKVLEKTRGTPNFVRLVRHFELSGQETGLLEVAIASPRDEQGVEALRMILNQGQGALVENALARADASAVSLAEALGNSEHRSLAKLLAPVATAEKASPELRAQAVRSLARTMDGARELLALVRAERLSGALRQAALAELTQVRWEDTRMAATKLREPATTAFPSVSELLKWRGDPARGELVFRRASPGCSSCHVVKGVGTDLGPNLSEIGSKLAREALFQSILEPSAGISFGYEAFSITFKDGEEAFGLIASETPDELAIKAVGGVITRYKKSTIAARQKATLSLMPAGLEAGLTPQELVDLVDFLGSLRKGSGE
jgi:putative heme-binding domain-containing protein